MALKDQKCSVRHHNVNRFFVHVGGGYFPVLLKSVNSCDSPVSSTVLSRKKPGFQPSPPHLLRGFCGF